MKMASQEVSAIDGIHSHILLEMLRRMWRIRLFDETASRVREELIAGALHNSIGQEAEIVGACVALRDDDYMTGNHRSHGHPIGKGIELSPLMAELFGKSGGVCRGKGGSMHLAAFSVGSLGESGIVGGSMPTAVGAGVSAQIRGTDQVCLCFFGDGTANCGAFHECLNLASVWRLPVVFMCENNGYAMATAQAKTTPIEDIADRADAYRIPGVVVDGQDVVAVYRVVSEAVARARAGQGPSLIEAKTYRFCEHQEGVPFPIYRSNEEICSWTEQRDPISLFTRRLLQGRIFTEEALAALKFSVQSEVDKAMVFAKESVPPSKDDLFTDVFGECAKE